MRDDFLIDIDKEEIERRFADDDYLRNYHLNIWEYKTGQTVLESYPWHVTLPVADLCNARCTFCNSWLWGKNVLHPDQVDHFAPLLRYAKLVGLHGHGEPLVNPYLEQIIHKVSESMDPRGAAFVITNGRLLGEKFELLRSNKVYGYSISLNAASAETHHKVMGLGPDAFSSVVATIARLTWLRDNRQKNLDVSLTFVLNHDNLHEAADFIRLGRNLRVNRMSIYTLQPLHAPMDGLNYHLLPPYLHPEFETHIAVLRQTIADSDIPVQHDAASWRVPVLSKQLSETLTANPPKIYSRREALADPDIRRQNEAVTQTEKGAGQPLQDWSHFETDRYRNETTFTENPLKRAPHFPCGYAYHYFTANHLNMRVAPCCYLTPGVPGFEPVVFDGTRDFMECWNSPAYQALRKSLRDGPLYKTCKTCPNQGRFDV